MYNLTSPDRPVETQMMSEATELAPGLQCCLRCGRVLTDRALHDSMEESMLYAIRARHPEWAQPQPQQQGAADETREAGGECQPCLSEYRRLLGDRRTRAAERLRSPEPGGWMPSWVNRMLSRTRSDARASTNS